MAEDWESGGDDYWIVPESAPDLEDILFGTNDLSAVDDYAHQLMWEGVVGDNQEAYDRLVEYMMDEYGIDFEDAWDWQDFAEWYEAQ